MAKRECLVCLVNQDSKVIVDMMGSLGQWEFLDQKEIVDLRDQRDRRDRQELLLVVHQACAFQGLLDKKVIEETMDWMEFQDVQARRAFQGLLVVRVFLAHLALREEMA